METPRKLSDVLHPAVDIQSKAAAFLLGLELASESCESSTRDHLAAALIESALNLHNFDRQALRIERRQES